MLTNRGIIVLLSALTVVLLSLSGLVAATSTLTLTWTLAVIVLVGALLAALVVIAVVGVSLAYARKARA